MLNELMENKLEIRKRYYKSGELQYETTYKNGRKYGIQKEYFDTGELASEITWKNGQKHGIQKGYFYLEENFWIETFFDKGKIQSPELWCSKTDEKIQCEKVPHKKEDHYYGITKWFIEQEVITIETVKKKE